MPPKATVMMPAFQAEATIREAVASVLAQSVPELELLVVDDASPTPVAEVLGDVSDPRLRVLRQRRNRGAAAARNAALAAARSPLVSQLDADDLWEPDYLEWILPCFEDPAIGLAYANATILGHPTGHGDYIGDPSPHPIDSFPKLAEANPVPSATATMRTDAVRAVGGYAGWLRMTHDYHLYMRLAARGWRFAFVPRRLARYRWPEATRGASFDKPRQRRWELAMFAAFVARHPRLPGPRRRLRIGLRRELGELRRGRPSGGR